MEAIKNRAAIMEEKKKNSRKPGRPPKITPDVISQLEYAYSIGCTDKEACLYANISAPCLYAYMKEHPEFKERRDLLKSKPILLARENVVKHLEKHDPIMTRWLLEHKAGDEYNTKTSVSVEAAGSLSIESREEALAEFLRRFTAPAGQDTVGE